MWVEGWHYYTIPNTTALSAKKKNRKFFITSDQALLGRCGCLWKLFYFKGILPKKSNFWDKITKRLQFFLIPNSCIQQKKRFQSKDIQYFISYNVWPFFVLSGCEYHIWYSKLIMLIMPSTIKNKSKNCVQINKMAIEEKT